MKKILFLSLVFFSLAANAQVFTLVETKNKFDDVVQSMKVKTLIEWSDSTVTVQIKGRNPVKYRLLRKMKVGSMGSEDNIVNLVDDVYGYQDMWTACLERQYPAYLAELDAFIKSGNSKDDAKIKELYNRVKKDYYYYIIDRVITTQDTGVYLAECVWIRHADGGNRVVYYRK